jgi:antitoxin component of MazEF toxin-antitoxin module
MTKTLTKVGNSQAVIIPKALIEKYNLHSIHLIEREDGILIVPGTEQISFHEKVRKLRDNKKAVYRRMKDQSSQQDTIDYYKDESVEDIDPEIVD